MSTAAAGFFITGTDTEVGKTRIACGLLYSLGQRGVHALGMKPVAAGCRCTAEGLRNDDAEHLLAVSAARSDYARVNPYAFQPAIAPHIAARDAGVAIDLGTICRAFRSLADEAECVVVEGVGGFEVPLGEVETGGDLAAALDLPVVLVVGMRLGCLNHALLTHMAIRARGLPCAGWVANGVDPHMARLQENVDTLRLRIDAPLLGVVPSLPSPEPRIIAGHLDPAPLLQDRF